MHFRLDEIFRQIQWVYSRHKTQKARQHALLSMTIAFLHGREISSPNQTNQLQQTLSCTVASLNKATLGIAAAAYEHWGTCQRDMPRRGRGLHARGGRATCPGAKCPGRTCQCTCPRKIGVARAKGPGREGYMPSGGCGYVRGTCPRATGPGAKCPAVRTRQ